jgi:hypothetical protein
MEPLSNDDLDARRLNIRFCITPCASFVLKRLVCIPTSFDWCDRGALQISAQTLPNREMAEFGG